jgi:hypothetical protein
MLFRCTAKTSMLQAGTREGTKLIPLGFFLLQIGCLKMYVGPNTIFFETNITLVYSGLKQVYNIL